MPDNIVKNNPLTPFGKGENNLPPQIQELLKKKGWIWPPDEKLKAQIKEAMDRFSGSSHTPIEILKEIHKDFPRRFPEN